MTYQVLARKWRPRTFEEVVGQPHVVRALANALDSGRVHHAFLFTGTRGVGKTTIARILAKCLNCEAGVSARPCGACGACREVDEGRFVDLLEVDAASRSKVEDTRDLLENVPYAPARGRFKVYLIDEVHMLSAHSFNALLKTLEEPPAHVKFLLATTDPQRLPVTVLSRCLQFNLKRLPADRIAEHLGRIAVAEGLQPHPAALALLARGADGSVRDGLSLLDQAIAYTGGALDEAGVRAMLGTLDRSLGVGVLEAVARGDGRGALDRLAELAERTPDPDSVLADLASLLHQVSVLQAVGELPGEWAEEAQALEGLARSLSPGDVQLYYQMAVVGRRDLPVAPDPRAGLEMTVVRMLAFRPATPDAVASRPAAGVTAPGAPPVTPERSAAAKTAPAGRAAGRGPIPVAPERSAARPVEAGPEAPAPAPGGPAPVGAEPARTESPDWSALVDRLGLGGLTRELAANAALLGQDGDTVRLSLAPGHAQMRSRAREAQIEEALGRWYGTPVRLVIEVGEPAAETPAQRARRLAAERRASAARALDQDPTVQRLRDTFDATLVDTSIRSVDPGDAEAEVDSGLPH